MKFIIAIVLLCATALGFVIGGPVPSSLADSPLTDGGHQRPGAVPNEQTDDDERREFKQQLEEMEAELEMLQMQSALMKARYEILEYESDPILTAIEAIEMAENLLEPAEAIDVLKTALGKSPSPFIRGQIQRRLVELNVENDQQDAAKEIILGMIIDAETADE